MGNGGQAMSGAMYKKVRIALWVILLANILAALVKIAIGLTSKSGSVTADGLHSISDGASNVIGLIGIFLAAKPSDESHPYGHQKFEFVASLFVGFMLITMAFSIISEAVTRILHPVVPEATPLHALLIIGTIALNIAISVVEYRLGKKWRSSILVADSIHTRSDIFVSAVVLLGLIGIRLGIPAWIDGVISLGVAGAILFAAWEIISSCVKVLTDGATVDRRIVHEIAISVPGVSSVHQIRSRGTPTGIYIDMHVIVNPAESVEKGHEISHALEKTLRERFGPDTQVLAHIETNEYEETASDPGKAA